jgi:hypothetical protein
LVLVAPGVLAVVLAVAVAVAVVLVVLVSKGESIFAAGTISMAPLEEERKEEEEEEESR